MGVLQQEIKGIFKLSFADFEFKVIKIIVFDLFGNALVIIEHPAQQEEINLSVHPDGTYLVSAIFDSELPPLRLKIYKS